MVQAVAFFAWVVDLAQAFIEAAEFGGAEGAGAGDVGLGLAQVFRQARTAEPFAGEPTQRQAEDFGGEVGVALSFEEQEEAAVVADQSEAAGLLARMKRAGLRKSIRRPGKSLQTS
jgi:hypothetical protein